MGIGLMSLSEREDNLVLTLGLREASRYFDGHKYQTTVNTKYYSKYM